MEPSELLNLGLICSKVRSSTLAAKGKTLNYIAPVCTESKVIPQLQQVEVDKCIEKWENAVVMFVLGETSTIAYVMRFMAKEWNHVATPKVFLHDDGYFFLNFNTVDDRNEILFAGPQFFFGNHAIIKRWSAHFSFHDEVLKVIPLWVRFPNLPLNCWGEDSLSRMSSVMGVPLFADECTTQQMRIFFARVLIEVDITKPFPSSIIVADANGRDFIQPVTMNGRQHIIRNVVLLVTIVRIKTKRLLKTNNL